PGLSRLAYLRQLPGATRNGTLYAERGPPGYAIHATTPPVTTPHKPQTPPFALLSLRSGTTVCRGVAESWERAECNRPREVFQPVTQGCDSRLRCSGQSD